MSSKKQIRISPFKKRQNDQSEIIQEPIKTVNGQIKTKKYKKIKIVGQGSYSQCFLVQTLNSDSTYVVKVIPKNKLEVLIRQKLVYQIKIHKSLLHQNVVHLDHWFQDSNFQYIFMEYCSNGNLESKLKEKGRYAQSEIQFYGKQILEALKYIHSKNVLHRDLKLCNFYLDENNVVKIGDFGFACQLAHPDQKKRQTCGTPNYIAPEAISGFGYSFTSDVWGLGVMLYRMKYGECPFEGPNVVNTLENVKTCRYSFPKGIKISKQLKQLLENVFILNYDERLTLQQISNHPFFNSQQKQRGFSISRLFSIGKEQQKDKNQQQKNKNKKAGQQKKQSVQPKRSNSCQTFKHIKQIMKSKTSINVPTQNTLKTDPFSQQQLTIPSSNITARESVISKTNRTYAEMNSMFIKKGDSQQQNSTNRSSKLYQYLKNQPNTLLINQQSRSNQLYQQKTSIKPSTTQSIQKISRNSKQMLITILNKYNLPNHIQIQKDTIIIHYKPYLKQVISSNYCFLLYRNKNNFYKINGQEDYQIKDKLPKVLKYIVENNIEIYDIYPQSSQQDLSFNFEIGIQSEINKLPQSWIINKDQLLLKYNKQQSVSKLYCCKIPGQQHFYLEGDRISLMYDKSYQIIEGVVIQRIYSGVLKNLQKKQQVNIK